jgi:hypothetical protein
MIDVAAVFGIGIDIKRARLRRSIAEWEYDETRNLKPETQNEVQDGLGTNFEVIAWWPPFSLWASS